MEKEVRLLQAKRKAQMKKAERVWHYSFGGGLS